MFSPLSCIPMLKHALNTVLFFTLLSIQPFALASDAGHSKNTANTTQDFRLKSRVRNALSAAPGIDVDRIRIYVRDAAVVLRGSVRSIAERRAARDTVMAIENIASVDVSDLHIGHF